MLSMNVIKTYQTGRALPVVYAPKKNVTLQFCVDYSNLIYATVTDADGLLEMGEALTSWEMQHFLSDGS